MKTLMKNKRAEVCAEQKAETGHRLREWRLRREKSQAEVARCAGITQASLSNYETGKREMPISTALGVAAALDVSLAELLDIPDVIVVRDSRLGVALETLMDRPDLVDTIVTARRRVEAEAAS
ncbi:MAG: helix-turn-helix transcriptional regulator [Gemmatimonadaceae bacterium]|nr:helix-turn-helix transcriptional regulator [Gemmatimonadaceae bacterium]